MKELKKKSLTAKDREQYIHKLRAREGRIAWTVNKARFGQNDILGCIDTISYTPWVIILDQTSTVNHISHKRAEIERMLINAPVNSNLIVTIHGVDGFREKQGKDWIPIITRHVMETWQKDRTWHRVEIIPPESITGGYLKVSKSL